MSPATWDDLLAAAPFDPIARIVTDLDRLGDCSRESLLITVVLFLIQERQQSMRREIDRLSRELPRPFIIERKP
jgi:hypothetical protein